MQHSPPVVAGELLPADGPRCQAKHGELADSKDGPGGRGGKRQHRDPLVLRAHFVDPVVGIPEDVPIGTFKEVPADDARQRLVDVSRKPSALGGGGKDHLIEPRAHQGGVVSRPDEGGGYGHGKEHTGGGGRRQELPVALVKPVQQEERRRQLQTDRQRQRGARPDVAAAAIEPKVQHDRPQRKAVHIAVLDVADHKGCRPPQPQRDNPVGRTQGTIPGQTRTHQNREHQNEHLQ